MNEGGCKQMEVDDFGLCVNKPWLEFWEGDDRERSATALAEAKQGLTSRFEGYCPTAKGTPKWWEVIVSPIRNGEGAITRILCISRDVTETPQAGGSAARSPAAYEPDAGERTRLRHSLDGCRWHHY